MYFKIYLRVDMEVTELSSKLISFPSVTPLDVGIVDYLITILEPLGFNCHKLVFEDVTNLYARYGTHAPNFCFAGHTDVVPAGDIKAWNSDPFVAHIENNILYGRGAVDMKPAIASFICAAKSLINNSTFKGSISLLITGDEEGPGINGTKKVLEWLKKQGEKLDHCLVGEPTNPTYLGEMVKIGRRGSACFDLQVFGTQGHVAYPDLADNPVTKLVNILADLKAHNLDKGNQFFQASNLEVTSIDVQNPITNLIAADAKAKFNIRYNNIQSRDKLYKFAYDICEKHAKNFDLTCNQGPEAFINKDDFLPNMVKSAIFSVLGLNAELSTTGGISDARFIKDYCPVIEFGLIIETAHKVNECVAIADIINLEKIYLAILQLYFA